MDTVDEKTRSKIMSNVKSQDSKIETRFRKALWSLGIRYRKNVRDLVGKPDIAIRKYKIVVFIDSCFWHGCPQHLRMPESNREYWSKKIDGNIHRDNEVNDYYEDNDWHIFRIWEHDIKQDFKETLYRTYHRMNKIIQDKSS